MKGAKKGPRLDWSEPEAENACAKHGVNLDLGDCDKCDEEAMNMTEANVKTDIGSKALALAMGEINKRDGKFRIREVATQDIKNGFGERRDTYWQVIQEGLPYDSFYQAFFRVMDIESSRKLNLVRGEFSLVPSMGDFRLEISMTEKQLLKFIKMIHGTLDFSSGFVVVEQQVLAALTLSML